MTVIFLTNEKRALEREEVQFFLLSHVHTPGQLVRKVAVIIGLSASGMLQKLSERWRWRRFPHVAVWSTLMPLCSDRSGKQRSLLERKVKTPQSLWSRLNDMTAVRKITLKYIPDIHSPLKKNPTDFSDPLVSPLVLQTAQCFLWFSEICKHHIDLLAQNSVQTCTSRSPEDESCWLLMWHQQQIVTFAYPVKCLNIYPKH